MVVYSHPRLPNAALFRQNFGVPRLWGERFVVFLLSITPPPLLVVIEFCKRLSARQLVGVPAQRES